MPANVQHSQLAYAGLSPAEIQAANKILTDFKTAWESLKTGYNQSVAASETSGVLNGGRICFWRRWVALGHGHRTGLHQITIYRRDTDQNRRWRFLRRKSLVLKWDARLQPYHRGSAACGFGRKRIVLAIL
jgi:hypothetical protein